MQQGESNEVRAVCRALVDELERGRRLLLVLTEEEYTADFEELELRSIGAHQRHILDLCSLFLASHGSGSVDYRQRGRSRLLESDRDAALHQTAGLIEAFSTFVSPDRPLTVRDSLEPGRPAAVTRSSVARELLYLLQHVIHHHALVRVSALLLGARVPDRFGVAPSTIEASVEAPSP